MLPISLYYCYYLCCTLVTTFAAFLDSGYSYVTDGRYKIDDNMVENSIRPLAIGRKNYLFCGDDEAAQRAAVVYSLLATCKAHGANERAWLEDVLRRIPEYE